MSAGRHSRLATSSESGDLDGRTEARPVTLFGSVAEFTENVIARPPFDSSAYSP